MSDHPSSRAITDGDVVAIRRVGAGEPATWSLRRLTRGRYAPVDLPLSEEVAEEAGRREAGGAR